MILTSCNPAGFLGVASGILKDAIGVLSFKVGLEKSEKLEFMQVLLVRTCEQDSLTAFYIRYTRATCTKSKANYDER